MPKFEVPDGWTVQAFRFTLDPTEDQAKALARHFGARRKAYNWTVATLKADIQAWHASGTVTAKPSLRVLRKRWNTVKDDVCVNTETGVAWWPECSKEAYADGIAGAVEAYWNWQTSRAGKRAGKRVRFPRFKRKAATRIECRSRPERCVWNPTAVTSPCRSSGPSARTRTPAVSNA